MKRLMILLVAMCSLVETNIVMSQETRYVESPLQDVNYTYEVCEGNIHYVYNLVFAQYIDSGEISNFRGFSLNGMWHEPEAEIPDVVTIPEKVHIQYPLCDLDFIADVKIDKEYMADIERFPDEMISFNTIHIPKSVEIVAFESCLPFVDVLVKAFDVEEGNNHNSYSENGVWFRKYNYYDTDFCEIIYFPLLAEWINYQFPDCVTKYRKQYYNYEHYPWESKIVTFFNENIDNLVVCEWPFYGVEIPSKLRNRGYSTKLYYEGAPKCNLKAFDCCNFELCEDLFAARFPEEYHQIFFEDLYEVYNVEEKMNNLQYVEFSVSKVPNITCKRGNEDFPEIAAKKLSKVRKVVTYVQPQLVEHFKKLKSINMFPKNADIVPIENKLYVYPELDHGRWVKGRTQMVYAVCRFGNSDIAGIKWETDNEEISMIDADGVLTVNKPGEVNVTCTITDTKGKEYEAKRLLKVTDKEITSVNEMEDFSNCSVSIPGVYNLHGMKVADTPDNIPAGIYIHDGKKIVVK